MIIFLSGIGNLRIGCRYTAANGKQKSIVAEFKDGELHTEDERLAAVIRKFAKSPKLKITEKPLEDKLKEKEPAEAQKKPNATKKKTASSKKK